MKGSEIFTTVHQSQSEMNLQSSFYHKSLSRNFKAGSTYKEKEIENKNPDLEKKFLK